MGSLVNRRSRRPPPAAVATIMITLNVFLLAATFGIVDV